MTSPNTLCSLRVLFLCEGIQAFWLNNILSLLLLEYDCPVRSKCFPPFTTEECLNPFLLPRIICPSNHLYCLFPVSFRHLMSIHYRVPHRKMPSPSLIVYLYLLNSYSIRGLIDFQPSFLSVSYMRISCIFHSEI